MKLCKNCEHFKSYYYCTATSAKELDPVDGQVIYYNKQSALAMRRAGTVCGPDAKLFKRRWFRVKDVPNEAVIVGLVLTVLVTLLLTL